MHGKDEMEGSGERVQGVGFGYGGSAFKIWTTEPTSVGSSTTSTGLQRSHLQDELLVIMMVSH